MPSPAGTNAPGLLEAHWTVESTDFHGRGASSARRLVPAKLAKVLELSSLGMMLFQSDGLTLSTIRSLPLGNERAQITFTVERDPDNEGYRFVQHIDQYNVSTYSFALASNSAARAHGSRPPQPASGAETDGRKGMKRSSDGVAGHTSIIFRIMP